MFFLSLLLGEVYDPQDAELTALDNAPRFFAIGSGCTPPKPGFISPRIS